MTPQGKARAFTWVPPALLLSAVAMLAGRTGRNQEPAPPIRPPAKPFCVIDVDPTSVIKTDPRDIYDVTGLPRTTPAGRRFWSEWTGGQTVRVAAGADSDTVHVYARRGDSVTLLWVVNAASDKVDYKLHLRMPRGIYTVERQLFSAGSQEPVATYERLHSVQHARMGDLERPGYLRAGEGAVYRFENQIASATLSSSNAQAALSALPGSVAPGALPPLREAREHLAAIRPGEAAAVRTDAARHAHRALMGVSVVQSLMMNARSDRKLAPARADEITLELAALERALTEISAASLGLDADVVAGRGRSAQEAWIARITVANRGSADVQFVRLSLTGLPGKQPVYERLAPGAVAQGQFGAPGGRSAQEISAEVTYFYSGAPARWKLRVDPPQNGAPATP